MENLRILRIAEHIYSGLDNSSKSRVKLVGEMDRLISHLRLADRAPEVCHLGTRFEGRGHTTYQIDVYRVAIVQII
jgi:hypothetical protein